MKSIKTTFITLLMIPFSSVMAQKSCPILPGTIKITYATYTDSGTAINKTYEITPTSIVWNYTEYRNNLALTDVLKYDNKEFEKLMKELSSIRFKVKENQYIEAGGEGWGFAFYKNEKCYLSYNVQDKVSGDYEKVTTQIQQFIDNHKTEGEKLFERLSQQPHERSMFGEFEELPIALQKYKRK